MIIWKLQNKGEVYSDSNIMKEEIKFNYFNTEIPTYRNSEAELRSQKTKAKKQQQFWKHLMKQQIYMPEIVKTKRISETAEINQRDRSGDIKKMCGSEIDIN